MVAINKIDHPITSSNHPIISSNQDAGVPIVVAINKIDHPDADVERTKRTLMECELDLEEIGGDVQVGSSVC